MAEAGGGGSSKNYLYISGNIWIDEKQGKQQEYNDLYDSELEKLYKDKVTVSLMNSSGRTVKTTTTSDGTYDFSTGISITSSTSNSGVKDKLSGYYLKFEFDDKYNPVSPKFEEENGSKALLKEGKDGEAYIYNLADYVEKFYKSKTLEHMNLGLIGTEDADYELSQNIAYVKVLINGYTYTYEYGGTGNTTKTAAPTVNWKNGSAYTRAIYPSDIVYSNENDWNGNSLKVYVVYRINITNTNLTNYGKKKSNTSKPVSYVEVDLKLTGLTNEYDKERYELETEYDKNKNSDFNKWNGNDGVATYTGDKLDKGIVPNKSTTVYIQFKIKDKALKELLNQKETYEKNPTTAKAQGYHNYWKAYYVGNEPNDLKLVFSDKKTGNKSKTASAYYLRLKINTERTITGTVFEDENIYTNGEHLGDSIYGNKPDGSKENTISNVTIDLISSDGDKAILYNSGNNYEGKEATTTSNADGTYSFVGVTPGKYYVRFTYGDGNQKIIKPDGTEDGTVSIADYKSTVAAEECIRKALGYYSGDKGSEEWYKHIGDSARVNNTIHNTGVDDLAQRAEYNQNNSSRTNIQAKTPLMSIGLENTEDNIATVTKSFEDDVLKEKILGINFGIIEIPDVSMAFEKVVSYIQITNSQGNIIAEGNPTSKNVKYVSDLDELSDTHIVKGSQYTKSEIKENELYGSMLKLTYSITVQNNSEVNYYEDSGKYYGYYYMYGDSSKSKEVTITVDNVLDFIDPSIQYENIDIQKDNNTIDGQHKINEANIIDNQSLVDNVTNNITNLTYNKLVEITEWKELYTTKNKDKKYSKDQTQDTAELTVTKLLSIEDDDLGVSNVAQVTNLHVTNRPVLVETISVSDVSINPTDEVYVMITPPTGADRMTVIIYVVVSMLALGIMSVGIVFIKKKVLDK